MMEKGVMPKQTTAASANRCHRCLRPTVPVSDDVEKAQFIYAREASVAEVQAARGLAICVLASTRFENCLASRDGSASFREGTTSID